MAVDALAPGVARLSPAIEAPGVARLSPAIELIS